MKRPSGSLRRLKSLSYLGQRFTVEYAEIAEKNCTVKIGFLGVLCDLCGEMLSKAFCEIFSEELTLNWNKWIRQTHRWLSMAFTVAVIVNIVAMPQKKYSTSVGLLAVVPLALQFVTGLYLFMLPYATRWRCARSTD